MSEPVLCAMKNRVIDKYISHPVVSSEKNIDVSNNLLVVLSSDLKKLIFDVKVVWVGPGKPSLSTGIKVIYLVKKITN